MKFNEKMFKSLQEFSLKFNRLKKEVASKVGLNTSEANVIVCLDENSRLSSRELGEKCDCDKSAISRVLAKMKEKRLISSSYEVGNNKTLYSVLTEKGRAVASDIKVAIEKCVDKYFLRGTKDFELVSLLMK